MPELSAISVLPSHSTGFERALEQASLWVSKSSEIENIWNPDSCPAQFLPLLSWGLSGDAWNPEWSEESRRAYVRATIDVHRKKGTVGGIKAALQASGYGDAIVLERHNWNFYNGERSRDGSMQRNEGDKWAEYRVILARPITISQADRVRELLKATAPARCHLKALDFSQVSNTYNARLARDGTSTRGIV